MSTLKWKVTAMAWVLVPLLWVHILCMSFWMGSMIFATVLGGQKRVQSALEAHASTQGVVARLQTIFPVAILIGVITGVLLGTVFGPIKSLGALVGTPFGLTMSAAFVLVVIAVLFGPAGPPSKPAWMTRGGIGELSILGAFSCMVLLHYGL
jgi:putative copper export protein